MMPYSILCGRRAFGLSKKLAFGDLFRHLLPVPFSAGLKTPRPTAGQPVATKAVKGASAPSDNSPQMKNRLLP